MDNNLEHRLTEVEERSKSNKHRLDKVEQTQSNLSKLVNTVGILAIKEEAIESTVKEIKSDVKSLAGKPGQRWEKLIETAITVAVSALVGFLLAKFGLG